MSDTPTPPPEPQATPPAAKRADTSLSTFRVLANGLKNPALANAVRVQLNLGKNDIDKPLAAGEFDAAVKALSKAEA